MFGDLTMKDRWKEVGIIDVVSAVRGTVVSNGHLVNIEESAIAIQAYLLELLVEFRHHIEITAELIVG